MDSLICWSWFVYIMLAAADWFPELLYDFYNKHRFALLNVFDSGVYPILTRLSLLFAVLMTVVYVGYLIWCGRRQYYISWAKLSLVLITFVVMYLTFVPNAIIVRFLPRWNFALGFATLGIVHVTQYYAIVWKYNRGLASRPERSRAGWFTSSFARGGIIVAAV